MERIDHEAKICPHCRTYTAKEVWERKLSMWKWRAAFVGGIIPFYFISDHFYSYPNKLTILTATISFVLIIVCSYFGVKVLLSSINTKPKV